MKITDEELETLQEQEKKKNAIAHDLGVLESKKHDLLKLLDDVREHQEITFDQGNFFWIYSLGVSWDLNFK